MDTRTPRKPGARKARATRTRFNIHIGTEQLEKVKRAAAKAHDGLQAHMGNRWPNASLFIVQAAVERAEKILAK